PLGEHLRDRVLPPTRRADGHGVVLRPPREDLDDSADLLVTADDWIDLALAREVREVAPVLLKDLVLALGILVGHALIAAYILQRIEHALARHAETLERRAGEALVRGHRKEQVLRRTELVAQRAGVRLGLLQDPAGARRR